MIFKWMNESEISIEGDFILKVKVSHDFKETYDSASVMVMADDSHYHRRQRRAFSYRKDDHRPLYQTGVPGIPAGPMPGKYADLRRSLRAAFETV